MLNKQGPNKIDWCDYTWNPISGRCQHNCPYCYMHSFWRRYPEMAVNQLKEKYLLDKFPKKPSKIFVGSSTDMWGEWVDDIWINEVLRKTKENPQHSFQFLTKNPFGYRGWKLPINGWYGTSFDGTMETENNINNLVTSVSQFRKRFVSFEPLVKIPKKICLSGIHWIIIGADSNKGAARPPIAWAKYLIILAREKNISVFVKDNYEYPEVIKEFPERLFKQ